MTLYKVRQLEETNERFDVLNKLCPHDKTELILIKSIRHPQQISRKAKIAAVLKCSTCGCKYTRINIYECPIWEEKPISRLIPERPEDET
jgi:hypothetical protein